MKYVLLDLTSYCNIKGISNVEQIEVADFSGIGSSYPAEEFPDDEIKEYHNIPFKLPCKMAKFDNMDFHEQKIIIPTNAYTKMHVLGSADNGSFCETIYLHNGYQTHSYRLGLSDWAYNNPFFQEKVAIETTNAHSQTYGKVEGKSLFLWYQSLDISSIEHYNSIKFGDNPGMHIFAITLERKGPI